MCVDAPSGVRHGEFKGAGRMHFVTQCKPALRNGSDAANELRSLGRAALWARTHDEGKRSSWLPDGG